MELKNTTLCDFYHTENKQLTRQVSSMIHSDRPTVTPDNSPDSNSSALQHSPILWKKLKKVQSLIHGGIVTFPNGTEMVVVAGGGSEQGTEFLTIDGNDWHFGPDLPENIFCGASVQLENTLMIVGR